MTENKRFYLDENGINDREYEFSLLGEDELVDIINGLNDEKEQLKKQVTRYKRLSEFRNEQINNRILTIKEFIDNCSNEKVKKELEGLFYSEVNEYDLSSENRKLLNENEWLKKENKRLTDKLNETALEFLNHDMVTMGKATEISEMSYYDFLKFRKENGNPMELQE